MNKTVTTLLLVGLGFLVIIGGYLIFPPPSPSPSPSDNEPIKVQPQSQFNDSLVPTAEESSQTVQPSNSTGTPTPNPITPGIPTPPATPTTTPAPTPSTPRTYQVTYTNGGYTPTELIIAMGDTVIFKNESTAGMWTASALHPSHGVYSGTSLQAHCPDADNNAFDQCTSSQPGTSWSFIFGKKGTWGYHNHVQAGHFGKVIVE